MGLTQNHKSSGARAGCATGVLCPKMIESRLSARRQAIAAPLASRGLPSPQGPAMFTTTSRAGRLRHTPPLLAALALCSGLAGAQTASKLEAAVDASVKPGDDFFAYANGAWLKATTIPHGKERWGARDEINEVNRRRIATLLDDARSAPPGSAARKVADFRAAWLDDATIESKGRAPLQTLLDRIDGVADKDALVRLLARSMRADVDPLNWGVYRSSSLLGLSVEPSIH